MPVVSLGSNISSLFAQRKLSEASGVLGRSFERLASGLRINRASDDAAGLSIAASLKADSRVYSQAIRNVNDGLSVLSIAQSALEQLSGITIRQKELAGQAASGTYSNQQRQSLNKEMNALTKEYNRIVESVSFNGNTLLNQNSRKLAIQMGYGADGSLAFLMGDELGRKVGSGSFTTTGLEMYSDIGTETYSLQSLRAYDFNNDGYLDIFALPIETATSASTPNVFLSDGKGGFQRVDGEPFYGQAAQSAVTGADFADFNGDGKVDMVTINTDLALIVIHEGLGGGSFGGPQDFFAGSGIQNVIAGDFNGDGKMDILTAGSEGVRLFAGNGNGSFLSPVTVGSGTNGLVWEDVNGDGIRDILSDTHLMLGNGNGTFKAGISLYMNGNGLKTGDFNGDGYTDIVNDRRISLGNGDGTFRAAQTYNNGVWGHESFSVFDLNQDGYDDIIAASEGLGRARVFLANGDGTFRAGAANHGYVNTSIITGDFNGDGIDDIAMGSAFEYTSNLTILFSTPEKVSTIQLYNISGQSEANSALPVLDRQLQRITSELGQLGSVQSRLGVALENISVARENFEQAAGRIMDADMAAEVASLVRNQILQQSSAAVLAQANLQPALVLKLLGTEEQ